MTEAIAIPPFPLPTKPTKGSACNGCGFCCHMEVCGIGKHFFPAAVAPCPAMVFEDGKVRCGIVMAERETLNTDNFAEMLGIGKGCCSDDIKDRSDGYAD